LVDVCNRKIITSTEKKTALPQACEKAFREKGRGADLRKKGGRNFHVRRGEKLKKKRKWGGDYWPRNGQ